MRPGRRPCLCALALLAAGLWHGAAQAQVPTLQERTLRILVPVPAGGALDLMARHLAQHIQAETGTEVLVEPRPGGNMILAPTVLSRSPADGSTVMIATNAHITNASMYRRLPFDTQRDFMPIALIGEQSFALLVGTALDAAAPAGLLAAARARDGGLNYGTIASGGATHLAAVMLGRMLQMPLTQIGYRGAQPALVDLAANRIDFMFSDLGGAAPWLQRGEIRAIAQSGQRRSASMATLPSLSEFPGLEDYDVRIHLIVYAPSGVAAAVAERLNALFRRAVAREAALARPGTTMDFADLSLAETRAYFDTQFRRLNDATRAAGIPVQE